MSKSVKTPIPGLQKLTRHEKKDERSAITSDAYFFKNISKF